MAKGDISAVIDSLVFRADYATYPSIIHVSGDVFAIAYIGPDNDGYVSTIEIDAAGNIGAALIDTLEFDTAACGFPKIYHLTGSIFAVVYSGTSADGFICTFSIDAAGNISNAVLDVYDFDVHADAGGSLAHVTGNIYAIAFTGYLNDGFIITLSIDAAGNIAAAETDRLEFDTDLGYYPFLLQVDTGTFAIAHQGTDSDGFVRSVEIDISGNIAAAVTDTLEFDTTYATSPKLLHVTGDVFAIAYTADSDVGKIVTFTISAAGDISNSVIDTLTFEPDNATLTSFIALSTDLFAVAYQGPTAHGFIVTFTIDASGNISNAILDSFEFETSNCTQTTICHVSGDVYAIAYSNSTFDGTLITLSIQTEEDLAPQLLLLLGVG